MKKLFKLYVMEELDDGTTRQYYEELPPNGKWLTRENLESVGVSKWAIDELFGEKP